MITTLEEFYMERYQALEVELLNSVSGRMSRDFSAISEYCIENFQRILKEALQVQKVEHIPCAYMSISLLNTSILERKPMLQVDFYNGDWVYGEPWARGHLSAEFLFREWEGFCVKALDDSFYVRNKLQSIAIKSLFWETSEKLMYIFACFAKYFAAKIEELPEFSELDKAPAMYLTCGAYLDWQERIHAVLPGLDITDISDDEDTAFRVFHGEKYRKKVFRGMNLKHCRFYDCVFRNCVFDTVIIADGNFRNCRFYNTDFIRLGMAGCSWKDCEFRSCRFMDSGTHTDGDEYFVDAEMVRVRLSVTKAINCDFSYFRLKECNEVDVIFENVKLDNSDWTRYVEVKADG